MSRKNTWYFTSPDGPQGPHSTAELQGWASFLQEQQVWGPYAREQPALGGETRLFSEVEELTP